MAGELDETKWTVSTETAKRTSWCTARGQKSRKIISGLSNCHDRPCRLIAQLGFSPRSLFAQVNRDWIALPHHGLLGKRDTRCQTQTTNRSTTLPPLKTQTLGPLKIKRGRPRAGWRRKWAWQLVLFKARWPRLCWAPFAAVSALFDSNLRVNLGVSAGRCHQLARWLRRGVEGG